MKLIPVERTKSCIQKSVKFIAPGKVARTYGQKPLRTASNSGGIVNASACKSPNENQSVQASEKEAHYNNNEKIGGVSAHTLIVTCGEDVWKEHGFTEESSFLDILNLCKKFIDIYSTGFRVTDGDGMPLRNDKELLRMMRANEGLEKIYIYVDVDETAQPLQFKMPQDNLPCASAQGVPKVSDLCIVGDCKINKIIKVHGNVAYGAEEASAVQLFITASKYYDVETDDLHAISECTTNKEFQIPVEALAHYLVAKFTPMDEDGISGEPKYAITSQQVADSTPENKRKRGQNKNKKVATLKSGEKLEIEFFNNRGTGPNNQCWSRHLGKIVRDKNICPVQIHTWKDLTESNKHHMWGTIKECFFHPNIELYREHTLEHMCDLWTAWRSEMNVKYVRRKTRGHILKKMPKGLNEKDWEWLLDNKFLTKEFQKVSDQNSQNRVNGVMPHRTGSKPHRQVIAEKGGNLNVAEIFYETRQKGGKFVKKEEKDKYVELVELCHSDPSLTTLETVEKAYGRQRHSYVAGFGGGMKKKDFTNSRSAYVKDLEAKLRDKEEENKHLKRRMDEMDSRVSQLENNNGPMSSPPLISTDDLAEIPKQVNAVERTPSMSELNEILLGQVASKKTA